MCGGVRIAGELVVQATPRPSPARALRAQPVAERVVRDGNILTTAGVSAGIDGALALVAEIQGRRAAETIQLMIEYDPQPLFDAGSPETAPPDLVKAVCAMAAGFGEARRAAAERAAAKLGETAR